MPTIYRISHRIDQEEQHREILGIDQAKEQYKRLHQSLIKRRNVNWEICLNVGCLPPWRVPLFADSKNY